MEHENENYTTLRISRENLQLLKTKIMPQETSVKANLDNVLGRILRGTDQVYVDIKVIDGMEAESSGKEVIIQLGDADPQLYKYRSGKFQPLDKLPFMFVQKGEVERIPLSTSRKKPRS